MQSLRRRVWATRFFENSVPDAFDAHFFNGLLNTALTTFGDNCTQAAAEAKIAECAAWLRDGLRVVASIDHSNYDPRDLYPR